MKEITSVLFVCLGNICRSPMAHAVFQDLVEKEGLSEKFNIDSAGTASYHVGELPDSRSVKVGADFGLKVDHIVRQFTATDFEKFDYIIGMDEANCSNMLRLAKEDKHQKKVHLMMDFDEDSSLQIVQDPWYGDLPDFVDMYHQLLQANKALLAHLKKEQGL